MDFDSNKTSFTSQASIDHSYLQDILIFHMNTVVNVEFSL